MNAERQRQAESYNRTHVTDIPMLNMWQPENVALTLQKFHEHVLINAIGSATLLQRLSWGKSPTIPTEQIFNMAI